MSIRILLAASAFVFISALASAQTAPQNSATADEIIRILTVDRMWDQMVAVQVDQLVAHARVAKPDLDSGAETKIRDLAGQYFRDIGPDVVQITRTLLSRHFTEAEQEELLAYHKSDIGRKSREVLPMMMDELTRRMPEIDRHRAEGGREPQYSGTTVEMFRVMGYEAMFVESGIAFADQAIAELKAANLGIPAEMENTLREEILVALRDGIPWILEFVDQFMAEHFTQEEQLVLLEYAKGEVGQKSAEITPALMQELGAWWGQLVQSEGFWQFVAELSAITDPETAGSAQ